jgi:hypothetical protein
MMMTRRLLNESSYNPYFTGKVTAGIIKEAISLMKKAKTREEMINIVKKIDGTTFSKPLSDEIDKGLEHGEYPKLTVVFQNHPRVPDTQFSILKKGNEKEVWLKDKQGKQIYNKEGRPMSKLIVMKRWGVNFLFHDHLYVNDDYIDEMFCAEDENASNELFRKAAIIQFNALMEFIRSDNPVEFIE